MSLNCISFSVTPQNPDPHFFIGDILYTYKDAGMTEIPQLDKVYLAPSSFFRLIKKNLFNAFPSYFSKIHNFDWAELIIPFFKSGEKFETIVTSVESKIKDFNFGFEFNGKFKNDCKAFNQIFSEALGYLSEEISEKGLINSENLEIFKDKTVFVTGYVSKEIFFNLTLITIYYEIKSSNFENIETINVNSGRAFFLQKSNEPSVVDYNFINDKQQDLFKNQIKQVISFERPQVKKLKPFVRCSK